MHLALYWRSLCCLSRYIRNMGNSLFSLLLWGFQWKDALMSMTFVGHAHKGQLLRKWLSLACASLDWKRMAFHRPFLVTLDFSGSTQKKNLWRNCTMFMTLHCLHVVRILNNARSLLLRHLIPDPSSSFVMSRITLIPQGTIKVGFVHSPVECYSNLILMSQLPYDPKIIVIRLCISGKLER